MPNHSSHWLLRRGNICLLSTHRCVGAWIKGFWNVVPKHGSNWQVMVGDLKEFCHKHLVQLINSLLKENMKGQGTTVNKRIDNRAKDQGET